MKSFLNFLTEATQSQAAMQAKKLGLKGDGHGGWIDRAGKVVARTEKGKLKFTEKRTSKGQEQKQYKYLHQNLKHQKNQHLKINHKKFHHLRLYLVGLIHQQ
jgi:hypothetical protein